jgi:hypothetical protein
MEAMCQSIKRLDAEFKDIQLPEIEDCEIKDEEGSPESQLEPQSGEK